MSEVLVFGRTEYAEPLTERASVSPEDDVLAALPEAWVELVTFPQRAVHWIIREGEDAESEAAVGSGR